MNLPWKEGRRALAHVEGYGWVKVRGGRYVTGGPCWHLPSGAAIPVPVDTRVYRGTTLPNQCPECYEVDSHAEGCRTAANLAAGVPAFWARWARGVCPPVVEGCKLLVLAGYDGEPVTVVTVMSPSGWRWEGDDGRLTFRPGEHARDGWVRGFVAIGPDGPTLAPWGQS